MTQSNRCLILGAGALGIKLGLQLQQCGHSVLGIRRRPERVPNALAAVAGDLHDPRGLVDIWRRHLSPEGDELCVILTPESPNEAGYRRTYVEGLINLSDSLRVAERRPHVTFVSSTSVFGDADHLINESHVPNPKSPGGRILYQAEQYLAQQDFPTTVVRFAGIYGPTRTRFLDSVLQGQVRGVANAPSNRIHEDDCVGLLRCVIRSIQSGLDVPEVIHGVDEDQATLGQVAAFIARRSGCPMPAFTGEASTRGGQRWIESLGIDEINYQLIHPDHQSGYASVMRALQS